MTETTSWLAEAGLSVKSAQLLDISDYQGKFDSAAAKAAIPGLAGIIFRLTQGLGQPGTGSPDPDAAWNHQQIAACGLRRGMYHFLDPHQDGAAQARYFVAVARQLGLTARDMLWLDNETAGSSPAAVAACARAFMAELDSLVPHQPRGVYTFISFATEGNCAGLGDRALWLAWPQPGAPAPQPPPPWARWTFWQWGYRDGTDADAFNGTTAELDQWLESFAAHPQPPGLHVADGHTSLNQLCAEVKDMTVHGALWETARHRPHGWGPMERGYVEAGNWNAPLPKGTEIWG